MIKYILFLVIFIISISVQAQENDCLKIIYNSIKQNIDNVTPNQNYFDRVDSLPKSTKLLLHFARLQKIDGKIYYEINEDLNKRPWIKNKLIAIADFIIKHNNEIGDLDMVINLFDENRSLSVTNFNKIYYSGPIFTTSYSKSDLSLYDGPAQFVLHPDYYVIHKNFKQIPSKVYNETPFEEKIDKAFFRGGNNCGAGGDVFEHEVAELLIHPRPKIFILSYLFPTYLDAKPTGLSQYNNLSIEQEKIIGVYETLSSKANSNFVTISDQTNYKYIISLDGEASSWSRPQIISFSNSLLLYQTDYIQWFQKAMIPYYNYVPLKSDLSDLLTQIDWARSNPDIVKKIIKNQLKTAQTCFTQAEAENQFLFLLKLYSEKFNYKITKKNFTLY